MGVCSGSFAQDPLHYAIPNIQVVVDLMMEHEIHRPLSVENQCGGGLVISPFTGEPLRKMAEKGELLQCRLPYKFFQ